MAQTVWRDPEQVEMLLVSGVVDARDHLRHAVALLGDLRDDDVVLVVAGHREHEIGRAGDPGALEDVDLGRVAAHHDRPELGLELLEAVAVLLDQRHLVAQSQAASASTFAPTLPPPATTTYIRRARLAARRRTRARRSSIVEIAVCVGQTVRRPRSA